MRKLLTVVVVCGCVWAASGASASEPGWEGRVVKFGAEREKVQHTDILQRNYRPLHVYGNTVRRLHYRGTAVPSLRDFTRGSAALVVRR